MKFKQLLGTGATVSMVPVMSACVLLLTACAGSVDRQQSNLYCIGRPVGECLQSLNNGMHLDDTQIQTWAKLFQERDIHGNPVAPPSLALTGYLRNNPDDNDLDHADKATKSNQMIGVALQWDPQTKIVNDVYIDLPRNPMFAKTPREYKVSGLWDVVQMVACPQATKMEVWNLYENAQEALRKSGGVERSADWDGISELSTRRVKDIPFCGHHVGFGSLSGHSTSVITLNNPTGAIFRGGVSFSL